MASKAISIDPSNSHKVISLKSDNQGSIALTYNPIYYAKKKDIDIQYHYIRGKIAARQINLQYIPTTKMIADGLTKALTHAKFHTFVKQMNIN